LSFRISQRSRSHGKACRRQALQEPPSRLFHDPLPMLVV
jgi:hypothetical protein